MWSKREQTILWIVTYAPLIMLMIFRFLSSNKFFSLNDLMGEKNKVPAWLFNKFSVEISILIFILIVTLLLYKLAIKYFLSGYEKRLVPGKDGTKLYIRKIQRLGANDYSFFLLTLLLPLISLDHTSVLNLLLSLVILTYVISIYVQTDAISVCPLFFFSGRKVYKAVISYGTKEEELENSELRKEAIIIIKGDRIKLNGQFRGEKLAGDVFYVTRQETKIDE